MWNKKLNRLHLILASGSPRRKKFFEELDLEVVIDVRPVEEVYPDHLKGSEIPDYLAVLKASKFKETLNANDVVITSDTVVWYKNESLAKPADGNEAYEMLRKMSNDWHEVITAVCFTSSGKQTVLNSTTHVRFKELSDEEIWYYINTYKPFDKAGAYGIQEWIGLIGIEEIKGSHANVVGLPTHLVHKTLMSMVS
ncbi:septum formation protein Maf [Cellulophaga sp. HaHa_2_95]|uniref:Maf family nucleotide pyrophosphatase n=1 Tax=unclassified Cellulophaga TaxID=2634405 RepID=UPI001C4ED225|nr:MULTISPECIES: Maf family nucleotide pyrophosphatase [unclassified Cellulophaga]QXP52665.1 septum formation protein Maf [Cellulophaga sp. HaHa_2_1]QXP55052.1 septum formation protein Maf [Cellulophaga sp. HaHa_2_95]